MYAQFIIRSGRHEGRIIKMNRRHIVLGSGEDCTLRIRSHGVARHHCAVFISGEALAVHNLARHGSTYVGDTAIQGTRRLEPGDCLRVGSITIEIQFDPAALCQAAQTNSAEEMKAEYQVADAVGVEAPRSGVAHVVGVSKTREWSTSASPGDAAADALKQLTRQR